MIGRLMAAPLAVAGAVTIHASQPSAIATDPTPSYTIAAQLDPETRAIQGRERVRWRNSTSRPASELLLILPDDPSAVVEVTSLRDTGSDRDLLPAAALPAPHGRERSALLRVPLDPPIDPGGERTVDLRWKSMLPSVGPSEPVVVAAHWFPRLAVLTEAGWIAHASRDRSHVFSDAAAFDVTIDVPPRWEVAATGREAPQSGSRLRRYVQSDASDFAFAVSRQWIERRSRVERPGHDPIDVRLLLRPEHAGRIDRVENAVRIALARAEESPAPYPYRDLTVLDLPWRSSHAGRVFPTLVTLSIRWMTPERVTELESEVARALAKHCWQHVIPADASAHPWLVDGVSAYAASRLIEPLVQHQLDSTVPNGFLVARFFGGFLPYPIRSIRTNDVLAGDLAAGDLRAARALQTLERYVGWPTFEVAMDEYARRFRFGHPTPADFADIVETASGRDLRWFFDQAFDGRRTYDYAVERVTGERRADSGRYRTAISIARVGDAVFSGSSRPPIGGYQSGRAMEIEVTFADGIVRTETWDGRARSIAMEYESAAPVVSVIVDPNRVLMLDARRTNNTWGAGRHARSAASRWAACWMTWLEQLLVTCCALA
jgi:hypothetical protein